MIVNFSISLRFVCDIIKSRSSKRVSKLLTTTFDP